jgi:hypothetical protein
MGLCAEVGKVIVQPISGTIALVLERHSDFIRKKPVGTHVIDFALLLF